MKLGVVFLTRNREKIIKYTFHAVCENIKHSRLNFYKKFVLYSGENCILTDFNPHNDGWNFIQFVVPVDFNNWQLRNNRRTNYFWTAFLKSYSLFLCFVENHCDGMFLCEDDILLNKHVFEKLYQFSQNTFITGVSVCVYYSRGLPQLYVPLKNGRHYTSLSHRPSHNQEESWLEGDIYGGTMFIPKNVVLNETWPAFFTWHPGGDEIVFSNIVTKLQNNKFYCLYGEDVAWHCMEESGPVYEAMLEKYQKWHGSSA